MGGERLSGFDAFFLSLESNTQPLNVCCLLELDPATMPGGYSFDRFTEALAARVDSVPDFRLKLADNQLNLAYPVWVEDVDFTLDRHVRRVAVPRPGGREELADLCGHIASLPLDRNHPLWELWVIEGCGGPDGLAVMIKSHHAALDGVAGADLMMQLCSLQPASPAPARVAGPGTANPLEIAASGLVDIARRPLRLVTLLPDTARTVVRTLSRAARGRAMAPPFSAPATVFNAPLTSRRNVGFVQVELADVKEVKNRFGITVNDVVVAMCAGALRQFLSERGELPEAPMVATMPMSVRHLSDRRGRNHTMWMFCRLPTDIADVDERLAAVSRNNSHAKEHGSEMTPTLLQDWTEVAGRTSVNAVIRLARAAPPPERPVHNLVLSNIPGPQDPLYLLGCGIEALYPFGPLVIGAGLNVTVMSFNDKLGVGVISCPDLVRDVWGLVDNFPRALKELMALR